MKNAMPLPVFCPAAFPVSVSGVDAMSRNMARLLVPANDNKTLTQRQFIVGAGNLRWEPPHTPNMNEAEVATLCRPLVSFHTLISEAHGLLSTINIDEPYSGIYAVSDIYGQETKIGMATSPLDRLAQLQTGNHRRLFIHRLFWVPSRDVLELEQSAHAHAGRQFERLQGEWFRCSPHDAHEAIADAVTACSGKYCVMSPSEPLWRAA